MNALRLVESPSSDGATETTTAAPVAASNDAAAAVEVPKSTPDAAPRKSAAEPTPKKTTRAHPRAIQAKAILLGERIDLRGLDREDGGGSAVLTIRNGAQTAFVFRYGVAVLFDYDAEAEKALLQTIGGRVSDPLPNADIDETVVHAGTGDGKIDADGAFFVKEASVERLQIVAHVLSKSLVLSHYETKIASVFDQIDPLAETLRQSGTVGKISEVRALLKRIGYVLLIEHRMVGRVEPEERPEVLWDHPKLEHIYARFADEHELLERSRAIENKLKIINTTSETLLGLVQQKHGERLEWYIIFLFVAEIFLTAFDLLSRAIH